MKPAPWHSRRVCSFCVECEVYAAIWVEIVYKMKYAPWMEDLDQLVPLMEYCFHRWTVLNLGTFKTKLGIAFIISSSREKKSFKWYVVVRCLILEPSCTKIFRLYENIAKELRIRISIYKLGSGSGLFLKNQIRIQIPLKFVVNDFLFSNWL